MEVISTHPRHNQIKNLIKNRFSKNNKDEKNFYSVFALSSDGNVSGDMDGWGQKVSTTQIEALAVAECMTNNNKGKCFIYAIDDEIVWK